MLARSFSLEIVRDTYLSLLAAAGIAIADIARSSGSCDGRRHSVRQHVIEAASCAAACVTASGTPFAAYIARGAHLDERDVVKGIDRGRSVQRGGETLWRESTQVPIGAEPS